MQREVLGPQWFWETLETLTDDAWSMSGIGWFEVPEGATPLKQKIRMGGGCGKLP